MNKLLFPQLEGKWKDHIWLNKYAKLIQEDTKTNPFTNPELFGELVKLLHKVFDVDYSWGGYMEDREELLEGTYLPNGGRIHLGINYWVPVNTQVHLPKEGRLIYSWHDPDQNGGWGGQTVFEINKTYYIFGHLKNVTGRLGCMYDEGDVIGLVAEAECNGGWYPHLHVQCMKSFIKDVDGYSPHDPYPWRFINFPNPLDII